jgi:transcriptional regulator with PAS, ATPase and Fis domain
MLAEYFLQEFVTKYKKRFIGLSDGTKELFLQYNWPGNVREIRNVLERAILLFDDVHLQPEHLNLASGSMLAPFLQQNGKHSSDLSLYDIEKVALLEALKKAGYNQSLAARMLKISRDTLRYRIKKHGLTDRP